MQEEGKWAVFVLPNETFCPPKGGDSDWLKISAVGSVIDERRDLVIGHHVDVFTGGALR